VDNKYDLLAFFLIVYEDSVISSDRLYTVNDEENGEE
jgi:hypothetical protein